MSSVNGTVGDTPLDSSEEEHRLASERSVNHLDLSECGADVGRSGAGSELTEDDIFEMKDLASRRTHGDASGIGLLSKYTAK